MQSQAMRLRGVPHCLFHKEKMQKCRDTDSDDSEENQEGITSSVNTSQVNTLAPLKPKWEFVARDIDSNDDDEEPELVDGVDFNVYLTRRLFDLPNRKSNNRRVR